MDRFVSPSDALGAGEALHTELKGNAKLPPRIGFDGTTLRTLWDAVQSKTTLRVDVGLKAPGDGFGFSDGVLPPVLLPGLVQRKHEPVRVLDLIPTSTITTPSVEFLAHTGTTGVAGVTGPVGVKPAVDFQVTPTTLTARKIAVTTRLVDESMWDFPTFQAYVGDELVRILTDEENKQVLSGDGTGQNLAGILTAAGLLTRDFTADHTADATCNQFDTLEQAVADLRTGASYTEPDAMILNPATWSKIRRLKDGYGRYLVSPDPSMAEVTSLWGVPVKVTTSMPEGEALIGNFQEGAAGYVRQGFTLELSNSSGDDFTTNQQTFRCEERLTIGVARATSLLHVVNL